MSDGGFRLLLLSAMYENGGNTTHRLLDGHPRMFVYPFESQLGTKLVSDSLSSMFPAKYRWPVFALEATPKEDYRSIIDEECKVRARTPQVSKFRHIPFDFDDDERLKTYVELVTRTGRSRARSVEAFFRSTFEAWKDHRRTGKEVLYVGYSPILVVDAETILEEIPDAHVLHVVRNPWSAYADTKKRPVPLSLASYLLGWTVNQYHALQMRGRFPDRFHLLRFEDLVEDRLKSLGAICEALEVEPAESLTTPSFNGRALEEVYPWGTIRHATPEANRKTGLELDREEREEVRHRARPYLEILGYEGYF